MNASELKQNIKGKSFKDQFDTVWQFISDTTLVWGTEAGIGNAAHYEFIDEDGLIYLKHNGAFGTNNNMAVDILEEEPLEITLMDRYNPKKVFILA